MTSEAEELLSTLIDGGVVEPDRLRRALEEPGAADTLVAFVRLRRPFEQDEATPGAAFYQAMGASLRGAVPDRRGLFWMQPSWLVASMLVLLAAAAGVWAGSQLRSESAVPTLAGIYCTDNLGAAHALGTTRALEGQQLECVLKGEWVPVAR